MNPEILLYGPIGSGGVTAEYFAKSLRAIGSGPVTVRVNSPGGDAFAGLAIFNLIRQHGNVTVIIDGLAASAASFAILGAKRIEMSKNAMLMLHSPHSEIAGESDDLRAHAELLDKVAAQMENVYASRTGKTTGQIKTWLNGETWFTAEEAKNAGLVDDISASNVVKFEYAYAFKSAPAAIAARLNVVSAPAELDPIKAELNSLKAELLLTQETAKIEALAQGWIDRGTCAALARFSITNQANAQPLVNALKERRDLKDEIQQLKEESRAIHILAKSANGGGSESSDSLSEHNRKLKALRT